MDSKAVSKKVDQSVQAETAPKKPGSLLQELCSCCRSSKKKHDCNSSKRSKSNKETVKPRTNKILESTKRTLPSSSTSNPEEIKRSKRRKHSKRKREENLTEKVKENKENKEYKEDKESRDKENKSQDKENIESKEREDFRNKEKFYMKTKDKNDRRERKKKEKMEKNENEKKEKERDVEQKEAIDNERKEIPKIKQEEMEKKKPDLIDNKLKVENMKNTESEVFSNCHNKEIKFASFASSSSVVQVLCSDQEKLPGLRKCPGFKKETTSSPFEPSPTISVQKYEELPSTSYKCCTPVDSHKQIQVNDGGPCSGYCGHYLETDNTNEKWKKFAKKNCKTKIENEVCKPRKRSKSPKPKEEPHPPGRSTFKENWKKLQNKLPFLHKKSKKSSKRFCRSHSGSEKKRSKSKENYCPSEESIQQQSCLKKNKKSKDKSKYEKVQDVNRSPIKDNACCAKSELQSISITVCTTRRESTQKFAGNYSSDESSDEE